MSAQPTIVASREPIPISSPVHSNVPLDLVERFAAGHVTLFVGAGLSAEALPTWSGLMNSFSERLGEGEVPEGSSYLDVAQFYEDQFGRAPLLARLRQHLRTSDDRVLEVHKALVTLPMTHIFTTNFDTLLETAFRRQNKQVQLIFADEDVPSFGSESHDTVHVVKIHGDLNNTKSIVFTARDYENYLRIHPAMRRLVEFVLQTRTVLFLGYSFSDPDLRMMLGQVFSETGDFSLTSYIVMFDPPHALETSLQKRNLQVIPLKTEGRKKSVVITQWLNQLSKLVRRSSAETMGRTISPRAPNNNIPPPAYITFVRRPILEDRVLQSLRDSPVTVLLGVPGAGKTTLANKIAVEVAAGELDIAFKYVIWTSGQGERDFNRWRDKLLTAVARTAGCTVVGQIPPSHLSRKQQEVTAILNESPSMIVVDDFPPGFSRDAVAWLGSLGDRTRVLLLTRPDGETHYPESSTIPIGGLSESEALTLFKDQAKELGVKQYVDRLPRSELCDLYRVSEGNPQIIEQSLGLVAGAQMSLDEVIRALETTAHAPNGRSAILFDKSWESLSEDARDILCVAPLFAETNQAPYAALQRAVSIQDDRKFEAALNELTQFKLLEQDDINRRCSILPTAYEFARRHLDTLLQSQPSFETEVRYRIGDYYLDFIRSNILRENPRPRYWNALVTDSMQAIDPEWPNIKPAMEWLTERKPHVFTEFVFLIVHYLDSRFLNSERVDYAQKAIKILMDRGDKTEDVALLRLDALGWTYVEEGELAKAEAEISAGLDLAGNITSPEKDDLIALGHAWRSRVRMEQKDISTVDADINQVSREAHECIEAALAIKSGSSWILARVHMVAGDLAFKDGDYDRALGHYEKSAAEEDKYGGEGGVHYQLAPRMAFAHLALHNASQRDSERAKFHLKKAHDQFSDLAARKHITLGKLYGEYGLALIAFVEKQWVDARRVVLCVREDVNRRTSSNILKRMTDKLFEDIERAQR